MGSLGALGIGLSVVFLGFVLVLVGELYYLVCWKKRRSVAHRIANQSGHLQQASLLRAEQQQQQQQLQEREGEEGVDDDDLERELREVSMIANRHQAFQGEVASTKLFPAGEFLMGPPRFLFTIREETKEELESERSRGGSMDLAAPPSPGCTPFVTPPSSPSLFSTPPATPSPSPAPAPLAREPPVHCTIFIPSPKVRRLRATSPATSAPRTTMMMLLLDTSPPGTPPPTPPGSAAYRTPPTHLYSPRFF